MRKTEPGPRWRQGLLASFAHAFQGVLFTLTHERNFRIHCAVMAYVIYFSRYYAFGRIEYAAMLLLFGLVLTSELFNTAVEKAVDLTTPAYNPLAKIVKDVAAGAVLVSALISAAVGVVLFWDPDVLGVILMDLAAASWVWVMVLLLTVAWIFLPDKQLRGNSAGKK